VYIEKVLDLLSSDHETMAKTKVYNFVQYIFIYSKKIITFILTIIIKVFIMSLNLLSILLFFTTFPLNES